MPLPSLRPIISQALLVVGDFLIYINKGRFYTYDLLELIQYSINELFMVNNFLSKSREFVPFDYPN